MSVSVTTDVHCDASGCGLWLDGVTAQGKKAVEARRIARHHGWRCDKTGDWCPTHAVAQDEGQDR